VITTQAILWKAQYREDMDGKRCSNPGCTCSGDVLHLHSNCPHGDGHLDIGCHHPSHVLLLGCRACSRILWCWHLAQHGEHCHNGGDTEPCAWGWEDWNNISESQEYTWLPICHPERAEVTYVKTRGEMQVRCGLGCKAANGYLRHAVRSRAEEVVQ
jgi:hypothetical protein